MFLPRVPSLDRSSARHYVADAKDPTNFKQLNATWLEIVEQLHLPFLNSFVSVRMGL